jgi:urea transporter
VLFIGGLVVVLDTARRTALHDVGCGAMTAGFVLAVLPWMNQRDDHPERDAWLRKRRRVLIAVAIVTVAAFLSVKLLR